MGELRDPPDADLLWSSTVLSRTEKSSHDLKLVASLLTTLASALSLDSCEHPTASGSRSTVCTCVRWTDMANIMCQQHA